VIRVAVVDDQELVRSGFVVLLGSSPGAGAVVAGSETDLAYVAGESGIATFAAVALVATVFLARAEVWRTEQAVRATEAPMLEPAA
jgi:DNA-binding NarL/FixJ family response regulator